MSGSVDPQPSAIIVRANQGDPYDAPGHTGVSAWNLHGPTSGGPGTFRVASSSYPPGASADMSATGSDVVYVVTSGALELDLDGAQPVSMLGVGDSVFLPRGVRRSVRNAGDREASIIVVAATSGDGS